MDELENKIEEAADLKYTHQSANPPYCEIKEKAAIRGFVVGAKSDEAKRYWQNGMFDEDDVKFFATRFRHHCDLNGIITNNDTCNEFDTWFNQNKNK